MIICSCNRITDHDLRSAMREILGKDAHVIITPGRIVHKLGHKLECARCAALLNAKIVESLDPPARQTQHDRGKVT